MRDRTRNILVTKKLSQLVCFTFISVASVANGQQEQPERKTTEPVFRVSKLTTNSKTPSDTAELLKASAASVAPVAPSPESTAQPAGHQLDRAIEIAEEALQKMQSEVLDYTAILVKREQVNGVLGSPGCIKLKVRCPRETDRGAAPFSVYMKFLKPRESSGREVIWSAGQNENKLKAHEGGNSLLSRQTFNLDPTGFLAMKGNRYPIYEVGIENLIIKLIEKAERDRMAGPCSVIYREGAVINKRPCSVIELTHHQQRAPYEFHKAQVFIDDELQMPVRYVAYDWPDQPGAEPPLMEEYTYVNIATNVGLTGKDFDSKNAAYKFR